jgi:hypothetical protein
MYKFLNLIANGAFFKLFQKFQTVFYFIENRLSKYLNAFRYLRVSIRDKVLNVKGCIIN